jgi:hypothetical protein
MSALLKIALVMVVLGQLGCVGAANLAKAPAPSADFGQDLSTCKYEALNHAYLEKDWWSALVKSEQLTKVCLLQHGWEVHTEEGPICMQSKRESVKLGSLL